MLFVPQILSGQRKYLLVKIKKTYTNLHKKCSETRMKQMFETTADIVLIMV